MRVGFVLRSTEIKPLYFDLFHSNHYISGMFIHINITCCPPKRNHSSLNKVCGGNENNLPISTKQRRVTFLFIHPTLSWVWMKTAPLHDQHRVGGLNAQNFFRRGGACSVRIFKNKSLVPSTFIPPPRLNASMPQFIFKFYKSF